MTDDPQQPDTAQPGQFGQPPPPGPEAASPGSGSALPPPPGPVGAPNVADLVPRRGARRRWRAIGGLIAAILVFAAGRIVVGLIFAGASSSIGALFGGPFDRLPADTRTQFEHRVDSAAGDRLNGLSDADKTARLTVMLKEGLRRLDDHVLVRRLQIEAAAVNATDVASCATFARTTATGKGVEGALLEKMFGSLDSSLVAEWLEINVEGIEAESKGISAPRAATQADTDAMYGILGARMTATDVGVIQALTTGAVEPDAAACSALRSLYRIGLALDAKDLATLALVDIPQ